MKRTRTLRSFSLFHKIVAVVLSATIPLATLPEAALALPHGGVVSKGQATLGYATGRLLVTQSTSSATFNWGSFNVKSGQSVVYKTPGASSVSLNYIGGTTPSSIDGRVTSNGILEFMNPNGLIFGSGSVVSAAGVMAFGSATPWGKPAGTVTNAGTLTATTGGTVALVGSSVTNSGTITAPGGEVLLAAGSTVTPILTTGGSSLSVATTGGGLVDDSGIVSAETVGGKTGTVILQSGMGSGTTTLESTAVLDASAPNGVNGGAITVNGYKVVLDELAPLNVSAPSGTPGTVTIDPTVTDVGTASALEAIDSSQSTYLNNSSVCIALTANIDLKSGSTPYNWTPLGDESSSSTYFTGTFNGNGHLVSGYTITATNSYGIGFIGYLGSGGIVKNLGVSGTISTSASYVGGIVGLNCSGTVETSYNRGSVTGLSGSSYLGGVVGFNTGTVETSYNTGPVRSSSGTGGGGLLVGGVVGYNTGRVTTSYNTGSVSGSSSSGNCVGGVVGENYSGTVETSYNTGTVSGHDDVGGVVGYNYTGDPAGTVEYSYNTGTVTGNSDAGGVVGLNTGTVTDTYYNNTIFTGSGLGSGGSGTTGISTSAFKTALNLSSLGKFNTWNLGAFQSSATSAPWFEGTVVSGSGTMTAPMLVPDLPTATVTGNSGTSVYNGSTVSPGYTTTYTMGATAIPTGITVSTSIGPNANSYTVTPTVSGTFEQPTTQTSMDMVISSGTWTITSAPLTVTGGITATNFTPVAQTVDLSQKFPSLPGNSSPGNSSDSSGSFSPSSSGNSITLSSSGGTSLSVIQPAGDDTMGDGILSYETVKQ